MTASGFGSDGGWGWLRPWVEAVGWRSGLRIGVEVRIRDWGWGEDRGCWGGGFCGGFVVGFRCGLCRGFFFFLVVGGWGCGWWWWLWPWLEVMSLKISGHGGFERKYQREGEAFQFVLWVFFFFSGWGLRLWLVVVAVAVAVAVVYQWWAWKAQAMEVLRANIRGREKFHQVEKDGKTMGERDKERVRNNKKMNKK